MPEAFLRTLVHEAGHAFNLFHPKHDVHAVPVGTTIMNQTGDVMGFADDGEPYPGNITFAFDDHNRHLAHPFAGPAGGPGLETVRLGPWQPVERHRRAGRRGRVPSRRGRGRGRSTLELALPRIVFRGQFVAAQFT